MNDNLDFPRLADFERTLYQPRDLVYLANISLTEDGLGAVGLDILNDLFRALTAALANIVDNYIGFSLAQKQGDPSANLSND